MSVEFEQFGGTTDTDAPGAGKSAAERAEVKKFLAISAKFLAGLILTAIAFDAMMGLYLHKTHQSGRLGAEVKIALERIPKPLDPVRIIFVGDSVAYQLFTPKTEPAPDVRFLTTNQAITAAGQYYRAASAISRCPSIRDVYLFYIPAAMENDMPRDFTHDYYCGYFHQPGQVWETFLVKRDIELTFAHVGRMLLPHVMEANSLSRPAFALQPGARQENMEVGGPAPAPPDAERPVTCLSNLLARPVPPVPIAPPGQRAVYLSPTSRYFLSKLGKICRARGIRLHILSCPVSNEKNGFAFADVDGIYDAAIPGDVPAEQLIDAVHFKKPFVAGARQRMIQLYGLDFLNPRRGN